MRRARDRWPAARSAAVLAAVLLIVVAGCSKRVVDGRVVTGADEGRDGRTLVHDVVPGETLAEIADNYYGSPERAEEIARRNGLDDAQAVAPGSALVLRFDEGEWQRAQQRAAAMTPYNRGVELMAQENLEAAESEFRLALEIAPDFTSARYNLALVLMRRGQHENAERMLRELVAERPAEADFLFALGHALFSQTRFDEAVATFRSLLAAHPDHRRGAFGLARSLQESGRTAEAIAAWEAYLRLDATSSWADVARRSLSELRGE